MAYLHAHPFWYINGRKQTQKTTHSRKFRTGTRVKDIIAQDSEDTSAKENIWTRAKNSLKRRKKTNVTSKKIAE